VRLRELMRRVWCRSMRARGGGRENGLEVIKKG
jgi:hypothetical protein